MKKHLCSSMLTLSVFLALLTPLRPVSWRARALTSGRPGLRGVSGRRRRAASPARLTAAPAPGDMLTFASAVFPPGSPTTITLTSSPLPNLDDDNVTVDATSTGVILNGSHLTGWENDLSPHRP